jgi:hypothetical protein
MRRVYSGRWLCGEIGPRGLRRLQLFEFLDQSWCPQTVRHGATDYLEAITSRADIYRPIQAEIFRAIQDCGAKRVVDLCSGGGGPWLSRSWREALADHAPLTVILTDKFPSHELSARLHADPTVTCVDFPVDAASVPESLSGFRTIFSSFHHFPDNIARAVLADAVRAGEGFAMTEVTSRTLRACAIILLMPLFAWILTPRMRPFRWSRLLLTYLLPLIPFVVLWDGLVSCFRTRTPQELLALTSTLPQYEWTAGYAPGRWLAPVYLIGRPKPFVSTWGYNRGLDGPLLGGSQVSKARPGPPVLPLDTILRGCPRSCF